MRRGRLGSRRRRERVLVAAIALTALALVAATVLLVQQLADEPVAAPQDAAEVDLPTAVPAPEPRPDSPTPATPRAVPTPTPTPTPEPTLPTSSPTPAPQPTTPAPAPSAVPASLLGTEWERLPTDEPVVALTFDAGANADAVAPILDTLDAEGVTGTFFLTGAWVERYPEAAERIGASHPIGNHSYDHPELTELGDAAIRDQLTRTREAIRRVAGRDDRPWFRFPFGDRDERTIAAVNAAGYGSVRWTVDTLGWQGTSGGMSVDAVVARVLDTLTPGQIILMHVGSHPEDGSTLDADALPRVIRELRERGYDFVTVPAFAAG